MSTSFEFLLILFAGFVGSLMISYGLTRLFGGRAIQPPIVGGTVRLKTTSGVYRTRLLAVDAAGWHLTAPLSRDAYVPLRPGEEVVLEAPVMGGAILARTSVASRDADTHEVIVAMPKRAHSIERRETRRVSESEGLPAKVESKAAVLLDVSPFGARVECEAEVGSGERVRLDLPWSEEPVFAWVLEVLPVLGTHGRWTACRVRFEDRAQMPPTPSLRLENGFLS